MTKISECSSKSMSAKLKTIPGKRVPVFVFPEELEFIERDQSSHKQVLTLYNPYDFNVKFEVFSNAPKRYAVVESKGSIKAQCCVDIVVRHLMVGLGEGPYYVRDKFRIDLFCENRRLIGRKLVTSTLTEEVAKKENTHRQDNEDFKKFGANSSLGQVLPRVSVVTEQSPGLWLVGMALLCLLVLLLPLEGESPAWPSYTHITVNQKLIASFALGLVTMAILKT